MNGLTTTFGAIRDQGT